MKKIDINEFIWFIILSGFTVYLYMLVSTGRIDTFVHPRMMKYVVFSLLTFGLLALFQVTKIFGSRGFRGIKPGFIIFLVPLALGFGVNPGGLNSDVAAQKGLTFVQNSRGNEKNGSTEVSSANNESAKAGKDLIEIDEKNFLSHLEQIQDDLEANKGKRVTLTGFIFIEDGFKKGEFVTARMLMSCCAADAQVVGFMCRYEKGKIPEKDIWVKVTGIIDRTIYRDKYTDIEQEIPVIIVETMESMDKPTNQYVYP